MVLREQDFLTKSTKIIESAPRNIAETVNSFIYQLNSDMNNFNVSNPDGYSSISVWATVTHIEKLGQEVYSVEYTVYTSAASAVKDMASLFNFIGGV